jgi:hypothetical protein
MSNYKIFYCDFNHNPEPQKIKNYPLEYEYLHVKSKKHKVNPSFHYCPTWKHRLTRSFVVKSPIDFEIKLNQNNIYDFYSDSKINNENTLSFFTSDLELDNPVLQLTFPNYFFWTYSNDDIWIECADYPLTSYKNNFVTVGAWFNLKNYPRNTSLGFEVVDKNKPIIVSKGDVLTRIRFYGTNLNNGIILEKKSELPKEVEFKYEFTRKLIFDKRNFMKRFLFKNNFSTCPFNFLHKKDIK